MKKELESYDDSVNILQRVSSETLVQWIEDLYNRYKGARQYHSAVWAKADRYLAGVHEFTGDDDGQVASTFIQITAPQVVQAHSRINENFNPPGDVAWDISAPEFPNNPILFYSFIKDGMTDEDARKAVKLKTIDMCNQYKLVLKDSLRKADWQVKFSKFVMDLVVKGTGVFGAPFIEDTSTLEDDLDEEDLEKLIYGKEAEIYSGKPETPTITFDVYSLESLYFDFVNDDIKDLDNMIVRHEFTYSKMVKFANDKRCKLDVIKQILLDNADGDDSYPAEWIDRKSEINKSTDYNHRRDGKFTVLQFWGWIGAQELMDMGVSFNKNSKTLFDKYMTEVWVCAGQIIKIGVSNLYKKVPFYISQYRTVPGCLYGVGVPEAISSSQDAINECNKAMGRNMGFLCDPGGFIDSSSLVDNGPGFKLAPGTWNQVKPGSLSKLVYKEVNVSNALNDLNGLIQTYMGLRDEQSGIPRNLEGNGGQGVHNRTLGGAQLQFNNAITSFKEIIRDIDNKVLGPFIKDCARILAMQWNKFDKLMASNIDVVAKGFDGFIAKETMTEKIQTFLTMSAQNPIFAQRVDQEALVDLLLVGTGIKGSQLVKTQSQIEEETKRAADEANVQQLAMEQAKASIQTNAERTRAEISPLDALVAAYKQIVSEEPADKLLKYNMLREILTASAKMTPEIEKSIEMAIEVETIKAAHQMEVLGREAANSQEPALDARLKMLQASGQQSQPVLDSVKQEAPQEVPTMDSEASPSNLSEGGPQGEILVPPSAFE